MLKLQVDASYDSAHWMLRRRQRYKTLTGTEQLGPVVTAWRRTATPRRLLLRGDEEKASSSGGDSLLVAIASYGVGA
jgi:hypothetical protein